ncbi:MAG TPA: glycosyltransferase family 39 protein [Ktedonobacterales bacterium]|nr:glycosyltransferase family 39 protein [Ktedonobacterales bacterium]
MTMDEQAPTATQTAARPTVALMRWDARRAAVVALGVVLVALCVWFHLYRLAQTPGWDPQEGYNLDLAWNLLHGRLRLFALTQDFAQHPPLFYLQLALSIRIFGYGMLAVRALAGLYAALTCVALLLIGGRMLGAGAALWGAAAYVVAPVMLANTRWGYSYSMLAFVGLLCLWATWEALAATDARLALRWLLVAAALAGLAAFSDYVGVAWIAFVALAGLKLGWRRAALALGVGAGLLAIGLLACLLAWPGVFLADVFSTGGRAAGGNPVVAAILLLFNYQRLVTYDAWLLLGLVGVFLVRPARTRNLLLGALALLALVILKVRTIGPSFHTATPLLPLLALGTGVALAAGAGRLFAWAEEWLAPLDRWLDALAARRARVVEGARIPKEGRTLLTRILTALLVFVVIGSPVALAGASDAVSLAGTLTTPQDSLLATPADAQATIQFTLAHAQRGDLVLASPQLAWAFDQPVNVQGRALGVSGADIVQTVAYGGQAAAFYPAGLPRDRWAYDISPSAARYVIVDDLLRQLAAPDQLPALAPILKQVERWPVVFRRGQYTVYRQR